MSTSNFDQFTGESLQAASGYLPDSELLTRLANEFFTALPNSAIASNSNAPSSAATPEQDIPAFPADHPHLENFVSQSDIPLPFETELNALLAPINEISAALSGTAHAAGAPSPAAATFPPPLEIPVFPANFSSAVTPLPSRPSRCRLRMSYALCLYWRKKLLIHTQAHRPVPTQDHHFIFSTASHRQ